jgi:hypothetical protein
MKIAIIGGGFTGCITALHCARAGFEVSLWESSDRLGGVLLDIQTERGLYYNGCQYLRQGAIELMGWPSEFSMFPHEYGSVTALDNNNILVINDSAQPSIQGEVNLCEKPSIDGSALERLTAYGNVTSDLINWAGSFGNLEQIDWRCLIPMQLSRMHFPEDQKVARLKMESHRANELLAIPRRLRGQKAENAWLPKGGYTRLFARLQQSLMNLGVDIRLKSPVKPAQESGALSLRSRSENINTDAIVWTANPQPLLRRLSGLRLDTPPVAMKLLVGDLRQGIHLPFSAPYYWQIFEKASCVVRLYVYELNGVLRFSGETFDNVDNDTAWNDLQRLMQLCGLGNGHDLASVIKQSRYVNYSTSEFEAFETLTPIMLEQGLIPGGWQHFGREEKVSSILSLINEFSQTRTKVASYG